MYTFGTWILGAVLVLWTPQASTELQRIGSVGQKAFYTGPATANLNWIESQEFCNLNGTVGMQLASSRTDAELALIARYLVGNAIDGFWLSATDFGSEGQFHWTRGGVVPHAVSQNGGRSENCLVLEADGHLTDENCVEYANPGLWAVCEAVAEEELPQPFECREEGKFPDPEHCDVFHQCVAHNGEFIDYKFTCPPTTNYCPEGYCGHPEDCPCPATRHYAQAPAISIPESVPRERPVDSDRVERLETLEYVGKVEKKEFYTFRPPAPYFNWIQSMEFCHANGMMLARMESVAEQAIMLSYLGIGGSTTYRYFWLSAIDYGSEDKYYWFGQGDPLNLPIYGNGGRHSNCLYLASSGPVYDWTCAYHRTATMYPLCQLEIY